MSHDDQQVGLVWDPVPSAPGQCAERPGGKNEGVYNGIEASLTHFLSMEKHALLWYLLQVEAGGLRSEQRPGICTGGAGPS